MVISPRGKVWKMVRKMNRQKVAYIDLLLVSLLIVNFVVEFPQTSGYQFPGYDINMRKWFLDLMNDLKKYVHSTLNASDFWLYAWNLTSQDYNFAVTRWHIAFYMAGLPKAYELTGDETYLAEAKWLADKFVAFKGAGLSGDWPSHTWKLYKRASDAGFFHCDVFVWFTEQRLNEFGWGDYDVISQVEMAISMATVINNSTDLGWAYNYPTSISPDLSNYVVNTFAPMLFLLSYLTSRGVKDYSGDIQRIYYSIEKFRLDDKYKYAFTDTAASLPYTLVTLEYILLANAFTPSLINSTKIKRTLDSLSFAEVQNRKDRCITGIDTLMAINQSIPFTNPYLNRTIWRTYDTSHDEVANYLYKKSHFIMSKRVELGDIGEIVVPLSFLTSLSVEKFETPAMSTISNYRIITTVLDVNTRRFFTSPKVIRWEWSTRLYVQLTSAADGLKIEGFDKQRNVFVGKAQVGTSNVTITWDKLGKNINWTRAPQGFFLEVLGMRGIFQALGYTVSWVFPNRTITQVAMHNGEVEADEVFAIEWYRFFDGAAGWALCKTNNATYEKRVFTTTTVNDSLSLESYINSFQGYVISLAPLSISVSNALVLNFMRNRIITALQRLESDLEPVIPELIAVKTYKKVIHSDAEVYNYNELYRSLSFALFASPGTNNTAYVYCGDQGEPVSVSGASSWSYDVTSKTLVVNVIDSYPVTITLDWTPPSPPPGIAEFPLGIAIEMALAVLVLYFMRKRNRKTTTVKEMSYRTQYAFY